MTHYKSILKTNNNENRLHFSLSSSFFLLWVKVRKKQKHDTLNRNSVSKTFPHWTWLHCQLFNQLSSSFTIFELDPIPKQKQFTILPLFEELIESNYENESEERKSDDVKRRNTLDVFHERKKKLSKTFPFIAGVSWD